MFFADGFGHGRAEIPGDTPQALEQSANALFARHLLGDRSASRLPGVQTFTQNCAGEPRGPFRTRNWRKQHPGEVRLSSGADRTLASAGGNRATAAALNPIADGGSCRTVDAGEDPGAATYLLPPAGDDGYTLMGSPTVIARLNATGEFPQIASRLWDVAPDGTQTLVARGIYRPTGKPRQVFQLHPNGWEFAGGHVPKLELLGQDDPYARPSNGSGFQIEIEHLALELPVRDRPGGVVRNYSPPK
jgi:hypothetical protein